MSELLQDEYVSIAAIYGPDTLCSTENDLSIAILTLPQRSDISTRLRFPQDYPEQCPVVLGPESSGAAVAKGEGQRLAALIESVLADVWTIGEPCVFALIEECTIRLSSDETADARRYSEAIEIEQPGQPSEVDHPVQDAQAATPSKHAASPDWTLSEVLTEKKSVFVARVASVNSPSQAKQYVSHLLANDKKAARATHNITAWRIRGSNGVQYQDCDDDGETAAGGRLLHLLELVDAWNVMVVVSRWYGGVHLGPDRFRLINQAARDALVNAGVLETGTKKKGNR